MSNRVEPTVGCNECKFHRVNGLEQDICDRMGTLVGSMILPEKRKDCWMSIPKKGE